ncbi:MAG: FAD-dependent thymidylate synthase [Gallionella sp.]|nr:FAD-dependent thymidylate synthase [Gallionella sp.]
MKIIKPSATIEAFTPNLNKVIEAAGRTCWKSDDKIEPGSAEPFIERVKGFKHESVLEHGAITVRFFCDRGVSHELVRHRMASFSQESTRYCNYSKGKFGGEITVVDCAEGVGWTKDEIKYGLWMQACEYAEKSYFAMLEEGATPQEARSILPNSLKTEVVMTANPREWRHVFRLRCDRAAHPQMREIMLPLFEQFCERWPELFADVSFTK